MVLEAFLSTFMNVMFHPSFAAMILLLIVTQVLLLTMTGCMVSFSSCGCASSTPSTCSLVPTFKNGLFLAETECATPASFANVVLLDSLAFERFRQLGVVLHKPLEFVSTFKHQWQLGLFSLYQPRNAISLQPFGKYKFVMPPLVPRCHNLSKETFPPQVSRCHIISKASSEWCHSCPPMGS